MSDIPRKSFRVEPSNGDWEPTNCNAIGKDGSGLGGLAVYRLPLLVRRWARLHGPARDAGSARRAAAGAGGDRNHRGPAAHPGSVLADAGYWSEANVVALEARGIEAFIATGRRKHTEPAPVAPRGCPPAGLAVKERMVRKLATLRGHAIYARRKAIVEPVFGQIKHARGFRQFLRRGFVRVQQEWALVCLSHNLLKLHTATTRD